MTRKKYRIQILLIFCITGCFLITGGCTSFTSTLVYPDAFKMKWAKHRSKGYPITLRVPTHVKVEIIEKSYLYTKAATPEPIYDTTGVLLRKYDFQTQILHTDKVFTVDQKRPLAGTVNYNSHFSPDHSIEKMQSKLADDSIDQIGIATSNMLNLLAGQSTSPFAFTSNTAISGFGEPSGEKLKGERPLPVSNTIDDLEGDDILAVKNVIAAKVFAIDALDFEEQVQTVV